MVRVAELLSEPMVVEGMLARISRARWRLFGSISMM